MAGLGVPGVLGGETDAATASALWQGWACSSDGEIDLEDELDIVSRAEASHEGWSFGRSRVCETTESVCRPVQGSHCSSCCLEGGLGSGPSYYLPASSCLFASRLQ